jgi:hypothetical protein
MEGNSFKIVKLSTGSDFWWTNETSYKSDSENEK